MKQSEISKAYPSLLKLRDYSLPLQKAYAIYKICDAISGAYDFVCGEEMKYVEECHGEITGDSGIKFDTPMDCAAFRDKLEALGNMETDIEILPVHITAEDLGEQKITPADIKNLEGFISFG